MNYYGALNTLKKRGFIRFRTFDNRELALDELWHNPIVSNPKEDKYSPIANGELWTRQGFVILRPLKEQQ